MILVLAEKPSAKKNFATALGGTAGRYNGEEYKICALRGHLRGLKDPEEQVPDDYHDEVAEWSTRHLPWDLTRFAWEKQTKDGCDGILKELKEELSDVDEVAIATDDDPSGEGEVLAWEALEWCGWHGKTSRMYFPDEAPKSVQKAFCTRKRIESMEADGDFQKGFLRDRWDLSSMQFVRAATSIARGKGYRATVRQGRLKSVIVALVARQQEAYESYVKKPFFEARFKDANGNMFARKVEDPSEIRFDSKEKVNLSALHESDVVEDSRVSKRTAPGKLLDLAALSAILARNEGFKPESVLKTYQNMYEAQVVSYPRTEDKTVTPEQFAELLPLAKRIADVVGIDASLLTHTEPRKTHVKEGGAHGANRPGPNVPGSLENLAKYGKEAQAIYETLAKNYLAILCEDYEYELVKGHIADFPEYIGDTRVPIPGKEGFKKVFDADSESADDAEEETGKGFSDTAVPYVHEGANQRPQRPTIKWLNKQLERHGVGTGATRTSPLADISKSGIEKSLLAESRGNLSLTECGKVSYALIDGCRIADPSVTKELFDKMELVGDFKLDPEDVLEEVADMVAHDVKVMEANASKLDSMQFTLGGDPVGDCPKCGEQVLLGDKVATCSSIKREKGADGKWSMVAGCGFSFFREIAHKKLDKKQVEAIVSGKRTGLIKGFAGKSGKAFDAYLELDPNDLKVKFVFPSKNAKAIGKCPRCGKDVLLTDKTITCSSNKSEKGDDGKWHSVAGCGFRFFREIAHKKLTDKQAQTLLDKHETGLIKGFKGKNGSTFDAKLKLDVVECSVTFDFPDSKKKKR